MFVYNVKVNSKKIFKIIFGIMIMCGIIVCVFTCYKVIFKNGFAKKDASIYEIPASNYTNILESVHNDLSTYIRTKN